MRINFGVYERYEIYLRIFEEILNKRKIYLHFFGNIVYFMLIIEIHQLDLEVEDVP